MLARKVAHKAEDLDARSHLQLVSSYHRQKKYHK